MIFFIFNLEVELIKKTDVQIAPNVKIKPIVIVAEKLGIPEAKVSLSVLKDNQK